MSDVAAYGRMERLLAGAERAIALIDRCRPLNTRTELERLEGAWQGGVPARPAWSYASPPDLSGTRKALEHAVRFGTELGGLGLLYAGRAEELEREASIVEALATESFAARARSRYPIDRTSAGIAADRCAARWAALPPPDSEQDIAAEDERHPGSLVRVVHALIASLSIPAKIVLMPDLASAAAAADGVVLVRPGVRHTESAARRIALHEVIGHVLPRIVARAEPLGLFRVGSASGADDEEGRALLLEEREGLLADARRRELGVRHLGALAVRKEADWVELVRLVLGHGFALRDALRLAARIARGGGLARELVYLPALYRVRAALDEDPALERYLERGRISVSAARALRAEPAFVEGREHRDVIGRLVAVPRSDIDLRARAPVGKRLRREDQIDAQPLVALEAACPVVPPGK
jgi:hypothetical protein